MVHERAPERRHRRVHIVEDDPLYVAIDEKTEGRAGPSCEWLDEDRAGLLLGCQERLEVGRQAALPPGYRSGLTSTALMKSCLAVLALRSSIRRASGPSWASQSSWEQRVQAHEERGVVGGVGPDLRRGRVEVPVVNPGVQRDREHAGAVVEAGSAPPRIDRPASVGRALGNLLDHLPEVASLPALALGDLRDGQLDHGPEEHRAGVGSFRSTSRSWSSRTMFQCGRPASSRRLPRAGGPVSVGSRCEDRASAREAEQPWGRWVAREARRPVQSKGRRWSRTAPGARGRSGRRCRGRRRFVRLEVQVPEGP